MRFIAEADSRIPLEFDPSYTFTDASVDGRVEFYQQLKADDFFEVAILGTDVVAFHIVMKAPYPPNFFMGNIITLWVHPAHRGTGLAAKLKSAAETWARKSGCVFMQTNVHRNNQRMMNLNEANGYSPTYICMRKKLGP